MKYSLGSLVVKTTLLLALSVTCLHGQTADYYVDASANPVGADGLSWSTAFPALEQALALSSINDNIWVAAGTYKPRTETIPGDQRSVSYNIPAGVDIYGGFDGTETQFSQRAGLFDQTILSGEVGAPGNTDNAYHVLTMVNNFLGNQIDGFVICGGNALGAQDPNGGAALTFNGNFAWFENVTFEDNVGNDGGALRSQLTVIITSKCTFRNNLAMRDGGAVSIRATRYLSSHSFYFQNGARRRGGAVSVKNSTQSFHSRSILSSCVFDENVSGKRGGAIHVGAGVQLSKTAFLPGGNLHVSNCTVHGNMAGGAGGGLWADESAPIPPSIYVDNSIFWANVDGTSATADNQIGGVSTVDYCDVQGGYAGTFNFSLNPLFVNASGDDFRLQSISPCRNKGDNNLLQMDITDIDGDGDFFEVNPLDVYLTTRVRQGVVDVGAAETFLGDAGGKGFDQ